MSARGRIIIIGGGVAGASTAMRLLETPMPPHIIIIDKSGVFGRGLAYRKSAAAHFLNVRAGRMSLYPQAPDHFANWALANEPSAAALDSFVSRTRYGDYTEAQLHAAMQLRPDAVTLLADEAIALESKADEIAVTLASGARISADAGVLALGNLPSLLPSPLEQADLSDRVLIRDPWAVSTFHQPPPDEDILIIGCGLTMVDVALMLASQMRKGRIIALSRRGLLPHAHLSSAIHAAPVGFKPEPDSASAMLHTFRQAARDRAAKGEPWQALLDELRAQTPALWADLPPETQLRFLRHARIWWDVHRHRLAPHVHAAVRDLVAEGKLQIIAGKMLEVRSLDEGASILYRPRGSDAAQSLEVSRIINCAGPGSNIAQSPDRFVRQLLEDGVARPHATGIGFDLNAASQIVSADGCAQPHLFAIGPLTQGAFWESTAVPEIREHSARLAQHILSNPSAH